MLGCKPSPNGEASSIPRISDQPFSLKIIPAPVVISELHFTLFLNFYLKPSSSWISDLEKKNPHKVLRDLLLFAPPPPMSHYLWSLVPCLPSHSTPATPNRRPQACSHLGGYALAVFSTQEAPSLEIHGLVPPPPSSFSLNVSFSGLPWIIYLNLKLPITLHPSFPLSFSSWYLAPPKLLDILDVCWLAYSLSPSTSI